MLPGMAPMGMFGGLNMVAVVSSTSATTATIGWPTGLRNGLQNGDVAVLFDFGANAANNDPGKVLPTGFTEIIGGAGGLTRTLISYKVLDGTETGNITGISAANNNRKRLYIVRGNDYIRDVSIMPSPNFEISAAAPANQTVPAHSGHMSAIVFGFAGGNSSTNVVSFNTETPPYAVKETVGTNSMVGYTIYSGPSLSQTCGKADTGFNVLASFYLGFS